MAAASYKVLFQNSIQYTETYIPSGNYWVPLYSVSENRSTIITNIFIYNTSSSLSAFVDLIVSDYSEIEYTNFSIEKEYILKQSRIFPLKQQIFKSYIIMEHPKTLFIRSREGFGGTTGTNVSVQGIGYDYV